MKLFAYLALVGIASTQELPSMGLDLEEDETQDLLDITFSRWAERNVGRLAESAENAKRALMRGPMLGPREDREWLEAQQKDVFGWTFEEKMKKMNPRGRYLPLLKKISQSKEFNALKEDQLRVLPKDPLAQKIIAEAMDVYADVFGGRSSSGRYTRSKFGNDELRSNATPEERKNMSRYEEEKARIEGAHLENDAIKDVFEDLEDLNDDIDHILDPKYPAAARGIKLDAALRWTPDVQKVLGMVADDFNIHNEKEFEARANTIFKNLNDKLEACPRFQRLRKTAERMVRAACKNVKIGDLPTGQRMEWVNGLAKNLNNVMKSGRPVRSIERMTGKAIHDVLQEIEKYAKAIDKIEQGYKH